MIKQKIEKFGFELEIPRVRKGTYPNGTPWEYTYDQYVIKLPHQCDDWVIANNTKKGEAISELERFIKEAQEVLNELKKA